MDNKKIIIAIIVAIIASILIYSFFFKAAINQAKQEGKNDTSLILKY